MKMASNSLLTIFIVFNILSIACHAIQTPHKDFQTPTEAIAQRGRTSPGNTAAQQDMVLETLVHQNRKRSYYLFIPSSYQPSKPMPLLLAFHGGTSQGTGMAIKTGFNQIAEREGFIVAYPNGIDRGSYGRWSDGRFPANDSIDDVSFVRAAIDQIAKTKNIDKQRIYATGGSNGGFFGQRLACEMSDQLAAVASVSATLAQQLESNCHPQRAIPFLMINGTLDKLVPWRGGLMRTRADAQILSVPQTVAFWRNHNGCSTAPKEEQIPDTQPDETTVVKVGYYNCSSGAPVVLYAIKGGGHGWPGGGRDELLENYANSRHRDSQWLERSRRLLGNLSNDIKASEEIWQFFRQYTLP